MNGTILGELSAAGVRETSVLGSEEICPTVTQQFSGEQPSASLSACLRSREN